MIQIHPLYLQFFDHYHQEEYWEAHEVLEELWQTQRSNDFYHGLIQIAAIMHQIKQGKVRGARKLAKSALQYLRPFSPLQEGVNVSQVLDWLELCLKRLPEDIGILSPQEMTQLRIPSCQLPTSKELR